MASVSESTSSNGAYRQPRLNEGIAEAQKNVLSSWIFQLDERGKRRGKRVHKFRDFIIADLNQGSRTESPKTNW